MAVRPSSSTKIYSLAVSEPPIATSTLSEAMVGQMENGVEDAAFWTDNEPGVNTSFSYKSSPNPPSSYNLPSTVEEVTSICAVANCCSRGPSLQVLVDVSK